MKPLVLSALALSCLFGGSLFAGTPEEKKVPIDHVYIPSGFDNNDTVEIVVTGFLPNLCHKSPSAKVEINDKNIEVEVTSLYYHDTSPFCPEMVVPFVETVSLGLLETGEYKVNVNGDSEYLKEAALKIVEATSSAVDEHNYAYVEYIEKTMGSETVELKGYHVSDCFVLDEIDHYSNGKDTYSILPKLKQIRGFCPMKMTPFTYEFKVPEELEAGKILLHVRTLNGKSVNTIYTNKK